MIKPFPPNQTKPMHKNLQNIIIAGCGYLGKKLVKKLLAGPQTRTTPITALVKSLQSQSDCAALGINSMAIDLDEPVNELPDALQQPGSLVYYFVPPPPRGDRDSRAREFLHYCTQNAAYPEKIVLISTTGVYGNCHGQWVDESAIINPQVDRARRRADAEQQFQDYCQQHSISLVILRVSGIYAPDKLPLKRIKAGTPIVREEDSPYSNRIHADDLTEICFRAGINPDIDGIFNCADGHPTTMYDYFMRVAHASHLPAPPAINLEQARTQLSAGMLSYMDESRRIDNTKLLHTFGLELQYPDLDSGLKKV